MLFLEFVFVNFMFVWEGEGMRVFLGQGMRLFSIVAVFIGLDT